MTTFEKSAGEPGTPSCSEGKQANNESQGGRPEAICDSLARIACDLLTVRDELESMIGEDRIEGTRCVALLSLVSGIGEFTDRAHEALGGDRISASWNGRDDSLIARLGGAQ